MSLFRDKKDQDQKEEFQTVLIPVYFPSTQFGAVEPDYDFKHASDTGGSYMTKLIMINPQKLKEGNYDSIANILTEHLKHRLRLVGVDEDSANRVGHYRSWYKASDGRMNIIAKVKKSDLAQTSDADGRLENVTCLKQGTIISLENIIGFTKGENFIRDFPEKGNNPAFAKEPPKEININMLMLEIAAQVQSKSGTDKKEESILATHFSKFVEVLLKMQSKGKMTAEDTKIFNEYKGQLEKAGIKSDVIEALNLLEQTHSKMSPGGPPI